MDEHSFDLRKGRGEIERRIGRQGRRSRCQWGDLAMLKGKEGGGRGSTDSKDQGKSIGK